MSVINKYFTIAIRLYQKYLFRLALLCGKYESNAIALRLALGICDRAIESYDVLLALLETELALKESTEGKQLFENMLTLQVEF